MKKTSTFLHEKKRRAEKISVLTAYDYPTACALQDAGIDVILVGDSVGTNVLGYANEREVTLADMCHHLRAVVRGANEPYVMVDLPYRTFETPEQALDSARILVEAGADCVKLEGAAPETVARLVADGIEVCGHLGYEPQHGTRAAVQGKQAEDALRIFADAMAVQQAGAAFVLLELVPEELAGLISTHLAIPTIGIGAGRATDAQVLVVMDILGYGSRNFRHNRRYAEFGAALRAAATKYRDEVANGLFPGSENVSHMAEAELTALRSALSAKREN